MPTLHTVNKSPFERSAFVSALNHMRDGDALLMIEDGVIGARKAGAFAALLAGATRRCAIYVLAPDLAARGIAKDDILPGATLVDYGGFVDLVAQHKRIQAWL